MDTYKNLPAPLRIGVPAVLVAALLLALFLMMRPTSMVTVKSTNDPDVLEASKKTLEAASVQFVAKGDTETKVFELQVAKEDETAATLALQGSGLSTRSALAKKLKCPNEPGFTGTRATQTRYDNCKAAFNIQTMLLSAGALAANVIVTDVETGDLSGPQVEKNVFVQVFLPTALKDNFPAESVANGIAISVASSIDRIIIQDDHFNTLFGRAVTASGGSDSAADGAPSSSGDCNNLTGFTDVAEKKFAVSRCFETAIGTQLTKVLGGSDRFAITAQAEIDSTQSTTETHRTLPGKATDITESNTKDGSSDADNKQLSIDTGSFARTESNPAGDLSKLKLTATLDANHVTPQQEAAVKKILRTYIDPARRDPAPVTTRIPFAAGTGTDNPSAEAERLADKTRTDKSSGTQDQTTTTGRAPARTSKALLAAMAVVVIGLVTAILILWRRSTGMAAERARLQDEFRNEQRLLDNFAQQSPDEIARELESLLGAPATQEPSYR